MTRVFAGGASPANSRPDLRHAWQECAHSGALAENVANFVNDIANTPLTVTNAACMGGVGFFGRVSTITLPYYEDYKIPLIAAKAIWSGCAAPQTANAFVAALLTFLCSAIRTTPWMLNGTTLIVSTLGRKEGWW